MKVHRIMAFACHWQQYDTIERPYVDHKDQDEENNHVENLRWFSAQDISLSRKACFPVYTTLLIGSPEELLSFRRCQKQEGS
ncbi:hypothetical protein VTP01DRAFT_10625 [Rhizomucor pusillus]|uniref:uncharacterized protein n=1 Tax=Rhizomucor pusillus TaxID=4840 RepID=UPI003743ABC4